MLQVHLDVLRRKTVLLLISDLNILQDELSIFEQIYTESRRNLVGVDGKSHMPYEVVWVPIVDPIEDYERSPNLQKKFEALRQDMPWYPNTFKTHICNLKDGEIEVFIFVVVRYTVDSPTLIERHVVEFVRGRWHFMNKPILVVIDPQGNEASLNALHMIWIWGTEAFPFTRSREEELWRRETFSLNLIIDGIDSVIFNWVIYIQKSRTYFFYDDYLGTEQAGFVFDLIIQDQRVIVTITDKPG